LLAAANTGSRTPAPPGGPNLQILLIRSSRIILVYEAARPRL